jgi:hypothetical protein
MGTVTTATTSRIMGEIRLKTKLRLRGVVDMPILRDGTRYQQILFIGINGTALALFPLGRRLVRRASDPILAELLTDFRDEGLTEK